MYMFMDANHKANSNDPNLNAGDLILGSVLMFMGLTFKTALASRILNMFLVHCILDKKDVWTSRIGTRRQNS